MVDAITAARSQSTSSSNTQDATYTVQRGDTLWAIARRNGISLNELIAANPQISNPNLIFPGQQINLTGGKGGANGTGPVGGVEGPGGAGGRNAADVAKQYLGRNASELRGDRSDNLPMNPNVPSNICCANFVSAVLTEAGQLPGNLHTDSVATLNSTLRSRGWTEVSAANARPGDVVIIQGGGVSHTEIYAGNGQMIGSNNRNPDGSQKVTYGGLDWALQHGAKILRAPASAQPSPGTGGTTGTGATNGTGAVGAPAGTREGRIEQAMNYFVGQGWSRAQAAGIVANLDAESGMQAGIRQIGGGPGFGLAQWEGPRQAAFREWAGKDIRNSTFEEQLHFVQHELTTSERGAGNRLRNATSAADAGAIVCRYYERPANVNGDSAYRAQLANTIFQR